MQLAYGAYLFPANGVKLQITTEMVRNDAGLPYERKSRIGVTGYLEGTSQSEITLAISALQTALTLQYQTLVFLQDDGNPSAHALTQVDSISGVVIINGPDFGESVGAEYCVQRQFSFTAEASYPLPGTDQYLISWVETLSMSGGDPLYVVREAVEGPPQRQKVYETTAIIGTQSGEAVGYRGYPTPPAPLFPYALRGGRDGNRTSQRTPQRRGNGYSHYPITWEYQFEGVGTRGGSPNLWEG